jgi:DNA helicase-2/ATP-dependent DNA helicase PcrA
VTPELALAIERLSSTQRLAAEWNSGACLVLAGPGVGKTTVLTTRIARLLDESPGKKFRILALTFTIKAGDEMRDRVEQLVPGLSERTTIGTFHSFCAQILRQHGSHLGIKPDFGVYDQDADRIELLRDAIRHSASRGVGVTEDDVRWLKTIDQLRSNLVSAAKTAARFQDKQIGEKVAAVYQIYEAALRERNIMDFNGMILDTCRLTYQVPGVAARMRQTYPYWLIDEFQDTSPAQYRLLRFMAGDDFRNLFAVADDDQIIYQWAGASYKQIAQFRQHFSPELVQLVENRRCPPEVVQAANNLIKHNSDRTPGKESLIPMRPHDGPCIKTHAFETDDEESLSVAAEIASAGAITWGKTAILGRTRAILQPVLEALTAKSVKACLVTRRDRFISPQFVWLQAALDQSLRPIDKQVFVTMVEAANKMSGLEFDASLLSPEAEASGKSYMEYWASQISSGSNEIAEKLAAFTDRLIQSRSNWRQVLAEAIAWLPDITGTAGGVVTDAVEDKAAWEKTARDLRAEKGDQLDLPELLQGLALRPKDPPIDPGAVSLLTIHSSKGLEFDYVWLVGLAETVLPSWQSLKTDAQPSDMEEERRNCFVAITRTQKFLHLSYANRYRDWNKEPSRFIAEMGIEH